MDTGFRLNNEEISVYLLSLIVLGNKPLGPGTANIHFATWMNAQNYYQDCGYDLGEIMPTGNDVYSILNWISAMITPSGAIEGTAVMSRFLADYRTGSNGQPNKSTHYNDMNSLDMAQIFGAYRNGVGGLTCFTRSSDGSFLCGFTSIDDFQIKQSLGPQAQQAYPYFELFSRYFEYYDLQDN